MYKKTNLLFLLLATVLQAYAQQGVLKINISGVPSGTSPQVMVTGPAGFSQTIAHNKTLTNLASGKYKFSSEITLQRLNFISKAYRLSNSGTNTLVKNDTQQVNLTYGLMPGSHKLWVGNQNAVTNTSTKVIGFAARDLSSTLTSTPAAKLTNKANSPRGIAFDTHGNLWVADGYSIKMFGWQTLGKSNVSPAVVLTFTFVASFVTFDAQGNLWTSDGQKPGKILRIPAGKLYTTGKPTPDIVLSGNGINRVQNIAFDAKGNLWATHYAKKSVVRLNASSIKKSSTTLEADAIITCQSNPPVVMTLSGPKALAFDKQGNLWVGFFGSNVIAKIPVGLQQSSGVIKPKVQISLNVAVLLHSFAFDEYGGLWTALGSGNIGKISIGQLRKSGKIIPNVIITSTDLKYASGLAFYPIPAGLPLK